MLLARIYESTPLACPQRGAAMHIVAFVTESVSVRRILKHIGEPPDPPRIAPARGPPAWETATESETESLHLADTIAEPEPDLQFEQTVS